MRNICYFIEPCSKRVTHFLQFRIYHLFFWITNQAKPKKPTHTKIKSEPVLKLS